MSPKLAAACTFVALSVSPCFAQRSGNPGVEPNRYNLSNTVRRAWQTDAKALIEMVTAEHPRGANRCWNRKVDVTARIECFQRLIGRHFLRQVTGDSTQSPNWCVDDANPLGCFESLAAQEVELWRSKRMMAAQ
ncbi:MAG: hypothetical protein EHM55_15660 [Acidobacteria bacterium]|nr:MAG: hypothetical protein EHM55_15660 [Acidobacteriota bacterium]